MITTEAIPKPHPIALPKRGKATGTAIKRASSATFVPAELKQRANTKDSPLVETVTGVPTGRRTEVLINIKKGLKFASIRLLETAYRATQKEIAQALSIPNATLNRRKKEGRLHADESDRVVRLARLKDAALALMNSDDAAVTWLRTPLEILGGESPLEHASTELGARDVEDLIGRLRHGVFS
jgi:putative toxin-antitoxin system antitoxin component (TIGR02293 family)